MRLGELFKTWRTTALGGVIAELFGGLTLNGPMAVNAGGLAVVGGTQGILTVVPYSAAPVMDVSLGNEFVMTITDAVAFVLGVPTNPPPAGKDQVIMLTYRNASGGAHGAGTFNAIFKVSANLAAVANNNSRTIAFRWNGVNWVEIWRTAADVAN